MSRILAYADRLSVRPGERLRLMVSCDGVARYDATLIRVIHGDINPDGPGYKEERIDLDLGGPFEGRFQPIRPGSCAVIEEDPDVAGLASFAVQILVWPTLPGHGAQTLMAREAEGAGFRLWMDERGAAAFTLSPPDGEPCAVATGKPMLAEHWYLLSAGYDAEAGRLSLHQHALKTHAHTDDSGSASASAPPGIRQDSAGTRFTLAARPGGGIVREHFNGRLEAPRLLARALAADEASRHLPPDAPGILAAWDFAQDIPTDCVRDVSGNGRHGRLVNLPARAVPGHAWTGDEHCWTKRPEHWGAIHFHEDDLYDCGWETDVEIEIPAGLGSGVYAVHLEGDGESYYVPFAVRPPRDKVTAPVVFLMPTASYMAYANNRIGIDVPETEIVCGRLLQLSPSDLFQQEHPELGLSFYDVHRDGSPVYYSSRLRPVINMQPRHIGHLGGVGSNVWQFNADTHILDWLEAMGEPFDVITDEDLDAEGLGAVSGYRAVITGSHPEYYSLRMLDAVQGFVDAGGQLMYLGGNGFYWRISPHPTLPGVIECRKSEDGIRAAAPRPGEFYTSFTGEYTGLWRRNGRAPNMLAGVGMVSQGFDISAPYVRTEASRDPRAAFIFDGVETEVIGDFGLCGGGAAGLELDAADLALGTPPGTLVLATSERHTDLYLMTPEDMNDPAPGLGGTEAEIIRANMTYHETPAGGAVFSTGSIAWAGSLSHNGYDNDVSRITQNVLKAFIARGP